MPDTKLKPEKRVRVTVELPESFIRLLNAKAGLQGWVDWLPDSPGESYPRELDTGAVLAWLILLEARGELEERIHAATPVMWRSGGPILIHAERKVLNA